jgi:uncharacterized protein
MVAAESLEKRFVVDSMLGKVAKWLRVLGFDAHYERLLDQEQIERHRAKGYLLITRNRRWCAQGGVICLAANDLTTQLQEIVARVPIRPDDLRLLHRCTVCNRTLEPMAREQAFGFVPDYVFETNTLFHQCAGCRKVYWPGSHPMRMLEWLHRVLDWRLDPP